MKLLIFDTAFCMAGASALTAQAEDLKPCDIERVLYLAELRLVDSGLNFAAVENRDGEVGPAIYLTDFSKRRMDSDRRRCFRLSDNQFASIGEQMEKAVEWAEAAHDAELDRAVQRPVPCEHERCELPPKSEWELIFDWSRYAGMGRWVPSVVAKVPSALPDDSFRTYLLPLVSDEEPAFITRDGLLTSFEAVAGKSLLDHWAHIMEVVEQKRKTSIKAG